MRLADSGPLRAQWCYFDLTHPLVIDKEIFDLLQQTRRQIRKFPYLGEEYRGLSDPYDAVIALLRVSPLST